MTLLPADNAYRRYVLRYYNRFANLYDLGEFIRSGTRQKAVELSEWSPGERVLDLCTGTGALALTFAAHGANVIGSDLARSMLERASRKGSGTSARWTQMDATQLAFAENSFDVTVLSLALHHMPEVVQALTLREVCRVTRRRVVIIEPDVPVKPNWVGPWVFVASIIDESEYMHEWARQDFVKTCETAGLTVRSVVSSTLWLHRIIVCEPASPSR